MDERHAELVSSALQREETFVLSAGTLAEALIVGLGHRVQDELRQLLTLIDMDVLDVTPERAETAAAAYAKWGKGFHPARLNYGDCFAYALAQELECPLLYVGDDFALTDVVSALAG